MNQHALLNGEAVRESIAADVATMATPLIVTDHRDTPAEAVYIVPNGYTTLRVNLAAHATGPARKTGTVVVRDADSFKAYVERHGENERTTLYANPALAAVTAVLNGHAILDADDTGWGDHQCVLTLETTPAWKRWQGQSGQWMTQTDFAEFVEDSLPDFVEPSAAHMLELAQTFHASSHAEFESANRLSSGERQIVWKETVAAKAGQRGHLDVPEVITIGLQPFKGGIAYKATARLRFRVTNGDLRLMVKVERMDEVRDEAFAEAVQGIHEHLSERVTNLTTLNGNAAR